MPRPFSRTKHIDVRDSVFSVIRGIQPTTTEALVGLCNALGAVIAEDAHGDMIREGDLIRQVAEHLPRYVEVYRNPDNNPLAKR